MSAIGRLLQGLPARPVSSLRRPEGSGLLRQCTCPWSRFRCSLRQSTRAAGDPDRAGACSQTGPRLLCRAVLPRLTFRPPVVGFLRLPTRVTSRLRTRTQPDRLWFPHRRRVPHISLVFREIWDTDNVYPEAHRMNRESEGKSSGIPHLAKNERDVGHPSFVREQKAPVLFLIPYPSG